MMRFILLQRDAVLYLLEYGQEYSKVRTEGGVEGLCATAYLLAEVALQTSTPAATPTITPEITPTPTVEIPRETEPVNTQEPSVTSSPEPSAVPAVYIIDKPNIIDNLAKVPKWVYIQIGAVAIYFVVRYFIKQSSKRGSMNEKTFVYFNGRYGKCCRRCGEQSQMQLAAFAENGLELTA